jgi:ribonucleotide monophosphatase NagD (HAD superfamily)
VHYALDILCRSAILDGIGDFEMTQTPITAATIKAAVDRGAVVYWMNPTYPVTRDSVGQYLIGRGAACIGLTWADGITLNGKPEDFIIAE